MRDWLFTTKERVLQSDKLIDPKEEYFSHSSLSIMQL
jgi:hypothetical protein